MTAIIDGTGSLGAALGPLLIGWLTDAYVRSLSNYMYTESNTRKMVGKYPAIKLDGN